MDGLRDCLLRDLLLLLELYFCLFEEFLDRESDRDLLLVLLLDLLSDLDLLGDLECALLLCLLLLGDADFFFGLVATGDGDFLFSTGE